MSGDIKQQLSNLHAENAYLKGLIANISRKPTLRDRFAMAALTGYVSAHDEFFVDEIAKSCYIVADEMMKERGKNYDSESS